MLIISNYKENISLENIRGTKYPEMIFDSEIFYYANEVYMPIFEIDPNVKITYIRNRYNDDQ